MEVHVKLLLLIILTGMMATACSHTTSINNVKTIDYSMLLEGGKPLAQALQSDSGMIVRVKKGDRVPLLLTATLPFAQLQAGENSLVVTTDFYLYMSKQGILISPDGKTFTPIYDMKGIKTLFGFKQGSLSIGFRAPKEEAPQMAVDVSTH